MHDAHWYKRVRNANIHRQYDDWRKSGHCRLIFRRLWDLCQSADCAFGNIARMPNPVNTPRWFGDKFRSCAYLIECLSWAGLSGSPVFYAVELAKVSPGPVAHTERQYAPILLGCVNGHIDRTRKAQTQGDVLLGEIRYQLNTGIATVTPACAVVDLLNHQEFQDHRASISKKEKDAGLQVFADCVRIGQPTSQQIADPNYFKHFELTRHWGIKTQ